VRRYLAIMASLVVVIGCLELFLGPADKRARHGADLEKITIYSDLVGEDLTAEVVVPEGAEDSGRPMLVFLHGRGENGQLSNLNSAMYDALADQGSRAPIVVFPSGGDHSYWHDRADGDWGRYVTDEVIPQIGKRFGADLERVAIGGISMGGFGSLDLARLHPGEFCAVGAHSPALWESGSQSAAGAFDDAADFARHDVVAAASGQSLTGLPVWLDSGDRDPFRPGIDLFAARLRAAGGDLALHIWPGEHEAEYWKSHWSSYMRFYATKLAGC
jgi:S-formylglutathione hydrolase FrmB